MSTNLHLARSDDQIHILFQSLVVKILLCKGKIYVNSEIQFICLILTPQEHTLVVFLYKGIYVPRFSLAATLYFVLRYF